MKVKHTLKPIYNEFSKILILGSMPSTISRENNFYYAHKTNRFWKILSILFNTNLKTNTDKENFLLNNNIAIFDMIEECDITGSSDSSVKNIKVNNLIPIIKNSNIKYIFCTGKLSYNLYQKYYKDLNLECFYLPSPSSANATYSLERLLNEYKIIKEKLDN